MGIDVAEAEVVGESQPVHHLMCTNLMKLVDKISEIFPELEAARPRCSLGIDSLCLLNRAIENAHLLFRFCSESSKFYLAIRTGTIVSRCEKSRTLLEQSLSQLQGMVPINLATEVSQIIGDLQSITFISDPSEEEAGKVLQTLFHQSPLSIEKSEIEALQFAAFRLYITTTRALSIEKRSVKKLVDKISDDDPSKNKIIYLHYLLKKYGKLIIQPSIAIEDPASNRCMDNMELDSVNSRTTSSSSNFSILSLGSSSSGGTYLSDSSDTKHTDTNGRNTRFLFDLNSLSLESQRKVVEELKHYIDLNDQAFDFMTSENFVEPLIRFLKDAFDLGDVKCQKSGSQLLLAFVAKNRNETPYLPEDVLSLLPSLLDSEVTREALDIMVVLTDHKHWRLKMEASHVLGPILKILDSRASEYQEPAIKILYNWSTTNNDSHFHILSSDLILKLVHLLHEGALSKFILLMFINLCGTEGGKASIAETSECIASIAELVNIGSLEDQEHAITVLLLLCTHCDHYCKLVMDEGIIPSLCSVSINGNGRGRKSAEELLRILKMKYCDEHEDSDKMKESASAARGFRRKMSVLTKFASFFPKWCS